MVVVRGLACLMISSSLILVTGCETSSRQQVIPVNTGLHESGVQANKPDYQKPSRSTTPAIVFTLTERAIRAMQVEDWLVSQRSLEQALRIAPNEAQVYLVYGDFHRHQNQYRQARQMYYRAISLAGEHSEAGRLAQTHLEQLPE